MVGTCTGRLGAGQVRWAGSCLLLQRSDCTHGARANDDKGGANRQRVNLDWLLRPILPRIALRFEKPVLLDRLAQNRLFLVKRPKLS